VPKSSMEMPTPSALSSSRILAACSGVFMTALSVIQLEQPGRQPLSVQCDLYRPRQIPVLELARREIHAMRSSMPVILLPLPGLAAGGASTHMPIGMIRPVSFASGMKSAGESAGHRRRASGSAPRRRPRYRWRGRAAAGNAAAVLARHGEAQPRLEFKPGSASDVHVGGIEAEGVCGPPLRLVHRGVGVAQQVS